MSICPWVLVEGLLGLGLGLWGLGLCKNKVLSFGVEGLDPCRVGLEFMALCLALDAIRVGFELSECFFGFRFEILEGVVLQCRARFIQSPPSNP